MWCIPPPPPIGYPIRYRGLVPTPPPTHWGGGGGLTLGGGLQRGVPCMGWATPRCTAACDCCTVKGRPPGQSPPAVDRLAQVSSFPFRWGVLWTPFQMCFLRVNTGMPPRIPHVSACACGFSRNSVRCCFCHVPCFCCLPPLARATPLSEQQQMLLPCNFGTSVLLSQGGGGVHSR